MKSLQCVVVAGLLIMASSVHAARPGYTYAGLGYVTQKLDENDCTQDGLFLEGSLALDGQFIVQGRHTDVTSNDWGCGSTSTQISLGYRSNYAQSSTIYALASLINRDYGPDSDGGLGLSMGFRTMHKPNMELGVALSFESIDSEDQLFVDVGARFYIAPRFSLAGEVSLNDEGNTGLAIGGRYSF